MAQSPVIYALIAKRAELGGAIADLEKRARQARADLTHIDATLKLFDPAVRPHEIRDKRPIRKGSGLFAVGEISSRIRDALREAVAPIQAEDIVRRAMADKGLDPDDKAARIPLLRSFVWSLQRMHVDGKVQKHGMGLGAWWTALAPDASVSEATANTDRFD